MQVSLKTSEKDNVVITQVLLKNLNGGGLFVKNVLLGNVVEI
jgi:hypothetical protein